MNIQISWPLLSLAVAILFHAFSTVWWASKVTSQLATINLSFVRLDKELEKRDIITTRMWDRIDELKVLVLKTNKEI